LRCWLLRPTLWLARPKKANNAALGPGRASLVKYKARTRQEQPNAFHEAATAYNFRRPGDRRSWVPDDRRCPTMLQGCWPAAFPPRSKSCQPPPDRPPQSWWRARKFSAGFFACRVFVITSTCQTKSLLWQISSSLLSRIRG
jgi:hypothetical protein